ncbi:uncharacterized protein B0T15DRAFT_231000 [Chaetomium strumarium]|uniref:Secreted protein n=1 Tax=Chaetomium strumarium TaxID=1170767 RepID=A0AAJ0GQ66_9PEZI|nr:hypothetical protein B0T15DRAFT_231000 [Chaetomium strumarium]
MAIMLLLLLLLPVLTPVLSPAAAAATAAIYSSFSSSKTSTSTVLMIPPRGHQASRSISAPRPLSSSWSLPYPYPSPLSFSSFSSSMPLFLCVTYPRCLSPSTPGGPSISGRCLFRLPLPLLPRSSSSNPSAKSSFRALCSTATTLESRSGWRSSSRERELPVPGRTIVLRLLSVRLSGDDDAVVVVVVVAVRLVDVDVDFPLRPDRDAERLVVPATEEEKKEEEEEER